MPCPPSVRVPSRARRDRDRDALPAAALPPPGGHHRASTRPISRPGVTGPTSRPGVTGRARGESLRSARGCCCDGPNAAPSRAAVRAFSRAESPAIFGQQSSTGRPPSRLVESGGTTCAKQPQRPDNFAASGPGSIVSRCRVQDGPTASLSLSSVIRDDLGVDGTSPSRRPSPSLEKSSPSLTISPVTSFFTCRSGPDSEKPHVSHCSAGRSPPESRRRYRDANSGDGT